MSIIGLLICLNLTIIILFYFRKYLSLDHGPIRSNPNFRWTWRYFLKFFTKGITKFMMQLDKIVDDAYESTEEVTETELSLDH